jgi:UV excision repair protein RAD23
MKLTFRNIANKSYQMDVDLSQTVASVADALASAYCFDVKKLRLIFKAKVLDNAMTLEECGIDGTGFIVIHSSAVQRQPAKRENKPIPQEQLPPPPPKPDPAPLPPEPTPEPIGPSMEALPAPAPGAPLSADLVHKVDSLMGMGFGRSDCEDAIRASHGNIDRAADFLLAGHIPSLPPMLSAADVPAVDGDDDADDDNDNDNDADEEEDEAAELRRWTRFRDELIRNPAQLRAFLSQMADENPAVASLIRDDPAAFLASIGLNPADFNLRGLGRTTQYEQLMGQFSEPEQQTIHTFEKMGFDTMTIIQVFVACDKDQTLTRDCLQSMQ